MHPSTHTHTHTLNQPCPLILIKSSLTHKYTQIFYRQVTPPAPRISVLSFTFVTSLSASPLALRTVYIGLFFLFYFLFGLPRPLINPTNSKGYINVDNQFLYVSSQSLEKNQKKKSKRFYSIVQMCFSYYF